MDRDTALELLRGGPKGIEEWNRRREEGEEIPSLERASLIDAHLEGADLTSAHLEGAKLKRAHLEGANLMDAHLEGAELRGAHLEGASLRGAHLEKAILVSARLEGTHLYIAHLEGADLMNAHLEGADLSLAHLEGAELNRAHLEGAELIGAHLEGADLRGADFTDVNVNAITYDLRTMRFQGVRVATCHGNALFKRDAQDQDWIETRLEKIQRDKQSLRNNIEETKKQVELERPGPHDNPSLKWWKKRWELLKLTTWKRVRLWGHQCWMDAWKLTDYGRSLWSVVLIAAYFSTLFGAIYRAFPFMLDYKQEMGSLETWWFTPFYYSMVTYTTLGFGDVTPVTKAGMVLVNIEVVLGYVTLGLLISILANKVARRS